MSHSGHDTKTNRNDTFPAIPFSYKRFLDVRYTSEFLRGVGIGPSKRGKMGTGWSWWGLELVCVFIDRR